MGLGAAAYYYTTNNVAINDNNSQMAVNLSSRSYYHKIKPIVDLRNQTATDADGSRYVRLVDNGLLVSHLFNDARTVYEAIRRGARESRNGECLGYRRAAVDGSSPYHWLRYEEVIRRSENLAQGLLHKDLQPGQSTFVGIYSTNRPEWTLTEQACYTYSMIIVPLYDTLGLDACAFILKQTEMKLLVVDKSKKAENLLTKRDQFPNLKTLVLIDPPEPSLLQTAQKCGIEVVQFNALELLGGTSVHKTPKMPPKPQDWSTICYTSGTTGLPKGAILTHANIIADCTALSMIRHVQPCNTDTFISFLPLAHMFERMLECAVLMVGGRIGFYRGDIRLLSEDLQELKPTIMPIVPRLLNRIYDNVMQEAGKNGLKKYLINWAVSSKVEDLKKSIIRTNSIWDKLVFRKVRNKLGGRVRLMITGSAPCSTETLTFIRAALGCVVLEGYGQTECVACATVSLEGDHNPGHVGPPIPCCKLKLLDVPEMNYFAKEGRGEVCIWGYNVFAGYYKDELNTSQSLDADGWLHTGDIGCWTNDGTLKLIDRKKHIFKLSQGEYIAPEKIEAVYSRSKFVAQCYVHGESLKSCLVAIVVPDPQVLIPYADKEFNLKDATIAELCKNEKLKNAVLEHMNNEGKKAGIASFEQVKDIYLHAEMFSVENDLLTPTFKSKRPAIREYFKEQIAHMYRKLT